MASLPVHVPESPMEARSPEEMATDLPARTIPLQCTVCPDTPTFSDVSHLLTHIASKGHLHHETQTKLKARQDENASMTLQIYEQWYASNDIESLLIGRMKAKQEKDATRRKKIGESSNSSLPKLGRRAKRPSSSTTTLIKSEDEEHTPDTNAELHSNIRLPNHDAVAREDAALLGDTMSLKGLVWPGMGKLDLANDEMKRIRNQKKPLSVIDEMRRTSEGISSEQVVYDAGFKFARTKDVYDDLTPDEDGREPISATKSVRNKRKKTNALADVSVNIPRRKLKQARHDSCALPDMVKTTKVRRQTIDSEVPVSAAPSQRQSPEQRGDEDLKPAFDDRGFAVPPIREHNFDSREQYNVQPLNVLSQPNLTSPTSVTGDLTSGFTGSVHHGQRQRFSATAWYGNSNILGTGPFTPHDDAYMFNDPACYYPQGMRSSFYALPQLDGAGGIYHFPSGVYTRIDRLANVAVDNNLSGVGHGYFPSMATGAQDSFANDRLTCVGQSLESMQQDMSPLAALMALDQDRSFSATSACGRSRDDSNSSIKLEETTTDSTNSEQFNDEKSGSFEDRAMWEQHHLSTSLKLPDVFQADGLVL